MAPKWLAHQKKINNIKDGGELQYIKHIFRMKVQSFNQKLLNYIVLAITYSVSLIFRICLQITALFIRILKYQYP